MSRMARICAKSCPICKRARTKGGIARGCVMGLRLICPMCRAYEREYHQPAYGVKTKGKEKPKTEEVN